LLPTIDKLCLGRSRMALKPRPITSEYNVSSNDVLSEELRVNVTCIRTGRVLWYQDRQLGENEILEGIYDTRASLQWVVHRPTRGWYIRIRSPAFPPGSFISLSPPVSDSMRASVGWLEFSCRTNSLPPVVNPDPAPREQLESDKTNTGGDHSYPPSASNSPSSSTHTLVPLPQSQITRFALKPSAESSGSSLLWRTISRFRHTTSFVLLPTEGNINVSETEDVFHSNELISFREHSRSSFATAAGVITLNETLALQLGVEKSFWVAVALAYWEFLNERESYLASSEG